MRMCGFLNPHTTELKLTSIVRGGILDLGVFILVSCFLQAFQQWPLLDTGSGGIGSFTRNWKWSAGIMPRTFGDLKKVDSFGEKQTFVVLVLVGSAYYSARCLPGVWWWKPRSSLETVLPESTLALPLVSLQARCRCGGSIYQWALRGRDKMRLKFLFLFSVVNKGRHAPNWLSTPPSHQRKCIGSWNWETQG